MRIYWQIPFLSKFIFNLWQLDAKRKYDWCEPWLKKQDSLLEIGSGPGSTIKIFREFGHEVTGLDIADNSYDDSLIPDIYNGINMPYADNQFDCALLLTTLHHTPYPDSIISEAMRVAKRIIIIEDVYDTPLQAAYTKITDSITNMEFIGHPHTNRSDAEWRACFDRFGLKLQHQKIYPLAKFFKQALYILDK